MSSKQRSNQNETCSKYSEDGIFPVLETSDITVEHLRSSTYLEFLQVCVLDWIFKLKDWRIGNGVVRSTKLRYCERMKEQKMKEFTKSENKNVYTYDTL
mmetsp:Transcript_26575/g.37339  ORF Transcript_26575/g.37339 Transcript_26575/m.37339 type:complete len:99 (+) Transcript_26575:1770-2066(+)